MTSAIAIRVIIRTGLLASLDSAHDDHLMALGIKLDTAGLAGWILNYRTYAVGSTALGGGLLAKTGAWRWCLMNLLGWMPV